MNTYSTHSCSNPDWFHQLFRPEEQYILLQFFHHDRNKNCYFSLRIYNIKSSQQSTSMSKTTGDQIVEYVYLQSYEELRKGGKDEEEAYEFAMKVSTSVQRVIENKIALRAVVLFLKSSSLYQDEDDD